MKSKVTTILIIIVVLVLAGIAIFTALRLFQTRREAVAPTAPESRPQAAATPYPYCSSWGGCNPGDPWSAAINGKGTGQGIVTVEADGTTQHTIMTNVWYTKYGSDHIKDQRAWINHQGDNAAYPRGLFRWAADKAVLEAIPNKKGNIISCICSNGGQCALGGGYAVIESGPNTGSEYIKELTSCVAWSNSYSGTQGQDPANHVFQFKFTVEPQWAPDGPNDKNDISVYATNIFGQTMNWTNNDLNFIVPFNKQCLEVKVYTQSSGGSWVVTPFNQLAGKIKAGDTIRLAVAGAQSTTKARIRVNSGNWQETTTKNEAGEFYVTYQIPSAVTFSVEAQVQ
ncbi:hypothetical protein A3F62_00600 [Candidatus Woesebacteria bacterium RIFCSPHIGHO2_12_FULL_44_11]|nr:MAG: hypothetical protein A3F62_00600 [Candidatus Woesebacteria bacterium RIFCSPHIGHO2_12_FULL_44_11]